ncbi:MAG: PA14 domain-containing protein [Bacteroidota bacterium]
MRSLPLLILAIILSLFAHAQTCTPAGDETSYGTSNTWIGYIYDNQDFTNYSGYVNEGTSTNPNFDESFGGDNVSYPTNGCSIYTETFSARYKLIKSFTAGQYQFTVGADDGYRLSIDGGATWIIDRWGDQSYGYTTYATTLGGTYNIVLEYYENGGGNRVSFSVDTLCLGTEDQSIYGTGDVWKGYIYNGTNFNNYAGLVTEGLPGNPNFDESFGGDYTFYNTSACGVLTEQFSARYRLQKTFASGDYIFTAGGDDGYRLSMDGGNTWLINSWADQGYATSMASATLNGTYDMVLEYYENAGGNRLSFNITGSLLPVKLLGFDGKTDNKNISLSWKVSSEINADYYQVEKSADGIAFTVLGKVFATASTSAGKTYGYPDASPFSGINFYRLRMVDKDGKYSYSPVIKIIFTEKKSVSIFPSVIDNGSVYISTSAELKNGLVELFDMTGKKLQQIRLAMLATGQVTALPLINIRSGTYALILKSGADLKAKQIIIVK